MNVKKVIRFCWTWNWAWAYLGKYCLYFQGGCRDSVWAVRWKFSAFSKNWMLVANYWKQRSFVMLGLLVVSFEDFGRAKGTMWEGWTCEQACSAKWLDRVESILVWLLAPQYPEPELSINIKSSAPPKLGFSFTADAPNPIIRTMRSIRVTGPGEHFSFLHTSDHPRNTIQLLRLVTRNHENSYSPYYIAEKIILAYAASPMLHTKPFCESPKTAQKP